MIWQNLMLTMKRWDSNHLLDHRVYCDRRLIVADCCYSLKAIVTHIGASASSGHYVAYRPNEVGFNKYDDTRLSHVQEYGDHIVGSTQEKVYILLYSKCTEPASWRLPPVKRPAIDLDASESDKEDSELTQPWPPRTTRTPSPPRRQETRLESKDISGMHVCSHGNM